MRQPNHPGQQQHYPSVPNIPHYQTQYPTIGHNVNHRPASMIMDPNQLQNMHFQTGTRPRSFIEPSSYETVMQNTANIPNTSQQQLPPRPDSITGQYPDNNPSSFEQPMASNMNTSTNRAGQATVPLHFVPICRYEDSQAIRAVTFHPSGKFFAIGTNSKQMLVCRYPDIRKTRYALFSVIILKIGDICSRCCLEVQIKNFKFSTSLTYMYA